MKQLLPALKAFFFFSILTGLIYPLIVTGVAQFAFRDKANGQFISGDRGSVLIAQEFKSPKFFWARPSAVNYNPMPSGGSNLGPTSAALAKQIAERRKGLAARNDEGLGAGAKLRANTTVEPIEDLLTSSASGLDPEISPDSARRQVDRVASARGLNEDQKGKVLELIESLTIQPTFGLLGDPRVNVLLLNLEMDRIGL